MVTGGFTSWRTLGPVYGRLPPSWGFAVHLSAQPPGISPEILCLLLYLYLAHSLLACNTVTPFYSISAPSKNLTQA